MISKDLESKIKFHYYRDHWPVGTIANQLGIHPDVVKRSIKQGQYRKKAVSSKILEPHLAFIKETFEAYPHLRATRMLDMLRDRGYTGSVYPLRKLKKELLPSTAKAFLNLKFCPGEQAQVDWGSFGTIDYDGKTRPLHAFVVVLSYSRRIFVRYFHDMKTARVLEGLKLAFEYFGGVPRILLFDNMKSAVIENAITAVRFNSQLLEFTAYHHCEPRACNPRAGWEKGRTERAIRYLRESFFAGRSISNIVDLNQQVLTWLERVADKRAWADDSTQTVREAFDSEASSLGPMPDDPFDPFEELTAKVDKKAMLRFDCNRYPVDPEWTGFTVIIRATHDQLSISHNSVHITTYQRLWTKGATAYAPGHQDKIAKARQIKQHRSTRHSVAQDLDGGETLIKAWAETGDSISSSSRRLRELIQQYGRDDVQAAVNLAIENGTPSVASIDHILIEEHGAKIPPPTLTLPSDIADIDFQTLPLDSYDQLYKTKELTDEE